MRVMELHAPVKVVQRSKGRTATAAAAYRSGTRIECQRTGQVHDYTRKRGIAETAMLLPDESPDWAHDRAALWNQAELREKHPRAQTAREIEVAFPAEFSAAQRKKAGLAIGQLLVSRYGTAADLAWHEPSRNGDQRNHHLHVMFTTRRFEKGEWAENKDRVLDDRTKGPEEVAALRHAVADVMNNIAAREKLDVYIEHLSFENRGLDREATQHLGPNASEMERRGERTDIGDKNREIAERNSERQQRESEKKVVDFSIAREELKRSKEGAPSPALANRLQNMQLDLRAEFYSDSQARRQSMLEDLDRQYGQQENEMKRQMVDLHQSIDHHNLVVRFWRRITLRTRQDKERLQEIEAKWDNIQLRRREAGEALEKERLKRLESMKQRQTELEENIIRTIAPEMERAARPAELTQEEMQQREIDDLTRRRREAREHKNKRDRHL